MLRAPNSTETKCDRRLRSTLDLADSAANPQVHKKRVNVLPLNTVELPNFWAALGNTLLWALLFLVFFAYIFTLFAVVADLFRDHTLGGFAKAVWIVFLVFLTPLTVLIYLIARGTGMQERAAAAQSANQQAADDYIRSVAGGPAAEIAQAKQLLDSGAITAEEFDKLKARALA